MKNTNPYNRSGYDKHIENVPCKYNCGNTITAASRRSHGRICNQCRRKHYIELKDIRPVPIATHKIPFTPGQGKHITGLFGA